MRILVAADEYPWPTRTGYRQRLHWLLRMLSAHGSVDLLVARDRPPPELPAPPPEVHLARMRLVIAGGVAEPTGPRAVHWLFGGWPRTLVGRDWEAARMAAGEWVEGGYDLVWFSHGRIYLALRDLLPGTHVVDLDNLESSLLRHRLRSRVLERSQATAPVVQVARAAADVLDQRRWRRLERQITRTAAATVVCSELDRRRLGEPRVMVVPNGYERPAGRTAAAPPDDGGPVLILVGLLTYEPNRDAATFFAREVFPLIRAEVPGTRFRVVGRYGSQADVRALLGLPGVEAVGEVADVATELRAADVAVVPIRFGGGTRIKILEAFAHGVPVVSTTVGCEGLDVIHGRHLLVADRPAELAAACRDLLLREDLRRRISAEAGELWEGRYRWAALAPAVAEVLRVVDAGGA